MREGDWRAGTAPAERAVRCEPCDRGLRHLLGVVTGNESDFVILDDRRRHVRSLLLKLRWVEVDRPIYFNFFFNTLHKYF